VTIKTLIFTLVKTIIAQNLPDDILEIH